MRQASRSAGTPENPASSKSRWFLLDAPVPSQQLPAWLYILLSCWTELLQSIHTPHFPPDYDRAPAAYSKLLGQGLRWPHAGNAVGLNMYKGSSGPGSRCHRRKGTPESRWGSTALYHRVQCCFCSTYRRHWDNSWELLFFCLDQLIYSKLMHNIFRGCHKAKHVKWHKFPDIIIKKKTNTFFFFL